jgi:hypothetical protein
MPPRDKCEHIKVVLELVLLLIAVPIVIWQLIAHPHRIRERSLDRIS